MAVAAVLMATGAPLHAIDIRIGDTTATRIAKDTTVPGKGVMGQCLPYAHALYARFCAAGINSKILIYRYHGFSAPATGGTRCAAGSHAVVAFEDRGRIYIADNQSWLPKWVQKASPATMAQQFSGRNLSVASAHVVRDGGSEKNTMAAGLPMTLASLR